MRSSLASKDMYSREDHRQGQKCAQAGCLEGWSIAKGMSGAPAAGSYSGEPLSTSLVEELAEDIERSSGCEPEYSLVK